MDLNKTGNLISTIRKEKGLTQKQLAEKLNISEKTVSKWERGSGLPDVSLMLPLCKVLEIDVNELLSGERLAGKEYRINAENNLLQLMDKTSPKVKYTVCTISAIITIVLALGLVLIAGFVLQSVWFKILMIVFSILLVVSDISVILLVAVNTEIYECCHCGEKFVPTLKEYICGLHTMKKRYLKCPHCNKKGWDIFHLIDNEK